MRLADRLTDVGERRGRVATDEVVEDRDLQHAVVDRVGLFELQRVAAAQRDIRGQVGRRAVQEEIDAHHRVRKTRVVLEHPAVSDVEEVLRAVDLRVQGSADVAVGVELSDAPRVALVVREERGVLRRARGVLPRLDTAAHGGNATSANPLQGARGGRR